MMAQRDISGSELEPAWITRLPKKRIAELCRKYGVTELCAFGSVLREDYEGESDVDFLVSFDSDDLGPWMARLTELQEDLEALLGRKVDLVPKESLKWVIRERVLESARVVFSS